MKFRLDRKTLVRILFVLLVIALLPWGYELVFLIDLGGMDLAVSFLMLFLATHYNLLLVKWDNCKRDIAGFCIFLSELYLFKPRVFLSHATASGVILTLTCSLLLACLLWIPVMVVSSGFIV